MKKNPRMLPAISTHYENLHCKASGYGKDDTPFFILGCVRSGTTLLRDLLRIHPRLESPEETHFFRWADPYASPRYENQYVGTKLFEGHRELDKVPFKDFASMMYLARDRREISELYAKLFLKKNNNITARWFDKTPQNIYGVLLLNYMYPESKFIHIYRSPFNVVSSLKEGKVMAKHEVKGGINYWMESMILMNEFKKLPNVSGRIFEIKYEDMVANPKQDLIDLLEFLDEDPALFDFGKVKTHKEKDKYKSILTKDEISYVRELCEPYYSHYGYK